MTWDEDEEQAPRSGCLGAVCIVLACLLTYVVLAMLARWAL